MARKRIRRSVLAGVDLIEHGTYMNEEDIALMKQHGTWYVPTLSAGHWVVEKAKVPDFSRAGPPEGRDRRARNWTPRFGMRMNQV